MTWLDDILDEMAAHGLLPDDGVIADGEIHRFDVDGDRRGRRNGNGPISIGHYSQCVAIKVNGEQVSRSCSNRFNGYEAVTGGYTVGLKFPAPPKLIPSDRVEISFILGSHVGEGEKIVPNLVYGGDIPLRTSFLEIGSPLN